VLGRGFKCQSEFGDGVITALPLVSGFVSVDAIADVVATGMYESDKNQLLIDVVTEMFKHRVIDSWGLTFR